MQKKSTQGFTLIELLVVIAIIGLLASIALVALNGARAKSRDAKRVADLNQLLKGLELYFAGNNTYPTYGSSGALSGVTLGQPGLVPNYMARMPVSQTPADGACTNGPGPGTNDYYFYANNNNNQASTYVITFCLGNKTGSLSAGPHTLTQTGFQ